MAIKSFDRGIHPSYHKELTSGRTIERAALPKTVIIPLQQHAGAPCEPVVKKGDTVAEGQKIADVKAFVSAPIHASVSGKVRDIELSNHPGGGRALAIIIDADGAMRDWCAEASSVDINSISVDAIRDAIREAGIVGMGGAAFPTSVKLSPPKGKTIDTVVLNGCECEPFLTADDRLMVEEADHVIWGLRALMKVVSAAAGIIGVEENKPEAVEALRKAIGSSNDIKLVILETKYPQGAEKMLIAAAMGRKVPTGKLPLDVGVIVNNVGTAAAIYEAVCLKKPLIERVVTISGNGVNQPKNLRVRIGTAFEDVLAQCGGLKTSEGDMEVLNGGPMMGITQSTLSVPVIKGTSGITVLTAKRLKRVDCDPCIKCASCVEVCPMGLMPYRLGDYGRAYRTDDLKAWDALSCIECGCCSYICPAKRPLVHWIRVGKLKIREEAAKAAARAAKA